jgi:hypothetical protein
MRRAAGGSEAAAQTRNVYAWFPLFCSRALCHARGAPANLRMQFVECLSTIQCGRRVPGIGEVIGVRPGMVHRACSPWEWGIKSGQEIPAPFSGSFFLTSCIFNKMAGFVFGFVFPQERIFNNLTTLFLGLFGFVFQCLSFFIINFSALFFKKGIFCPKHLSGQYRHLMISATYGDYAVPANRLNFLVNAPPNAVKKTSTVA